MDKHIRKRTVTMEVLQEVMEKKGVKVVVDIEECPKCHLNYRFVRDGNNLDRIETCICVVGEFRTPMQWGLLVRRLNTLPRGMQMALARACGFNVD